MQVFVCSKIDSEVFNWTFFVISIFERLKSFVSFTASRPPVELPCYFVSVLSTSLQAFDNNKVVFFA